MKHLLIISSCLLLIGCSTSPLPGQEQSQPAKAMQWIGSIFSSEPKKLGPHEYVQYVENIEKGLKTEKTISDFSYMLQYKPLEYEALRNLDKDRMSSKELDSMKNLLSDMQYFTFSIRDNKGRNDFLASNTADYREYQETLNYLSNEIYKDISLVDGNDTLPCLMHHWERTFGVSPDVKMVLAFKSKKGSKGASDKTLIYTDLLLTTGIVKLKISGENINRCPQLTFSSHEDI